MSAKHDKPATRRRTARMAPAMPRVRGGGATRPATASPFASRQALECVDGAYAWR